MARTTDTVDSNSGRFDCLIGKMQMEIAEWISQSRNLKARARRRESIYTSRRPTRLDHYFCFIDRKCRGKGAAIRG